ncbi:hypothetical protein IAQ61_003518 [Plenodomus lingam]|uniref:uncharacterized protein n=1 Tax=Leptosphaeria maculans TaxID=5022 RepID=UPI00331C3888|nr:hypothetical protein IAQ61_003518 [Plenodomus lingam]
MTCGRLSRGGVDNPILHSWPFPHPNPCRPNPWPHPVIQVTCDRLHMRAPKQARKAVHPQLSTTLPLYSTTLPLYSTTLPLYSTTITLPPLLYHHYSATITLPPLLCHHHATTLPLVTLPL